VILASSEGSRLFPMTTAEHPKHLLPVAGIPSIVRLLSGEGPLSAFSQIVIAIGADDTRTVPVLLGESDNENTSGGGDDDKDITLKRAPVATMLSSQQDDSPCRWKLYSNQVKGQTMHVIKLTEDCFGSIDALRQVESTKLIHPKTRMVVFPGDLVFLKSTIYGNTKNDNILDALIRPPSNSACVCVVVDVLEQDEHGHPLKESAKVSLVYVGLSLDVPNAKNNRIQPTCFHFYLFWQVEKRRIVSRRRRYRVHGPVFPIPKLDWNVSCHQRATSADNSQKAEARRGGR
jgi:hypothetical protein